MGIKECLIAETQDTRTNREASNGKGKKAAPIEIDGEPASAPKPSKGKGKDEHDLLKMIGVIERCGVVITEVQGGESIVHIDGQILNVRIQACSIPVESRRI